MRKRYPALIALLLAACTSSPAARSSDSAVASSPDSAYQAMDHRHGAVVGADPSALTHQFVRTPAGGDVILERKAGDTMTIRQIRAHLEEIARAFSTGDFSTPMLVHEKQADGADVMTRKASAITYTVEDIANGSVLRIRTSDGEALRAIYTFIDFQNREHRTK